MNTSKKIRSAQDLVMFNGFGSSYGESFDAGTPFSEVLAALLPSVGKKDSDTDKLKRQRTTYAKLVSAKTGRILREWSEMQLLKLKGISA